MESQPVKRRINLPIIYLVVIVLLGLLIPRLTDAFASPSQEIPYSEFKTALYTGKISSVSVGDIHVNGKMTDGTLFTTLRVNDPDLIKALEAQKVEASGFVESGSGGIIGLVLSWVVPMALMIGIWYFFIGRSMKNASGAAGGIFSFGKSKVRVIQGEQTAVSFKDVGGAGEDILS
jgi:cell division protease FtsH